MNHLKFGSDTQIRVFDQFCGAGGSSSGARDLGMVVEYAVNHSKIAIETHSLNFPETGHDCLEMETVDPKRYHATDVLITSPECRAHSYASGRKRPKQRDLFGEVIFDPDAERSRATAQDVIRFARQHRYKVIIVENVPQFRDWYGFTDWLQQLRSMDYEYQIVYINAMFAHERIDSVHGIGDFVPQSRDRMFVVLWQKGMRRPNLDFRPDAPCPHCGKIVHAVQAWKRHDKQFGIYGKRGQYIYICPACNNQVIPFHFAAANIIDWSNIGVKIGEREQHGMRPLKETTMARCQRGLEKYWASIIDIAYAQRTNRNPFSVDDPLSTRTTSNTSALVVNPFMLSVNHQGDRFYGVDEKIPTVTAKNGVGLIVPAVLSMRDAGRDHYMLNGADAVLPTQVAAGIQQWLVGLPSVVTWRSDGDAFQSSGAGDPLLTQTTQAHHSVITAPVVVHLRNHEDGSPASAPLNTVAAGGMHHALLLAFSGSSDIVRGADGASPTFTTVQRNALMLAPNPPALEDCYFRMLDVEECKLGQSFDRDYQILGTKRQQMWQIGNANPRRLMAALLERVAEIL